MLLRCDAWREMEPPEFECELVVSRLPARASREVLIFTVEHYRPTKAPLHPAPPSLIRSLTMRPDCVEGNANLAIIGTLLVARVFFKVITIASPE